ncbi:hypothetical protein HYQ44_003938 [Verticillium longisporum]|nr:hypothetical protein HYQ44_003938 [Verticillium longisporum]
MVGGLSCEGLMRPEQIWEAFPELRYLPRPEPPPEDERDHHRWEAEYQTWQKLRCKNDKGGYFCRKHGLWITCDQIDVFDLKGQKFEGLVYEIDGTICILETTDSLNRESRRANPVSRRDAWRGKGEVMTRSGPTKNIARSTTTSPTEGSLIKVITFVWAPARVALQAFDEAQRASQEAVDGIVLIEGHLISWIETAAHSSGDDRICDIVVGILASAIDLAFLAKEHLSLQSAGRFFSSLRPGTVPLDKFTKKKTALQDAMSTLSTALHDKRIKFQLDTTTRLESIDVGLSLTEHRVVSLLHVHQSSVEQALKMYDTWLRDWRASSKDTANLKDIRSWLEKDAASFSFQDSHRPIKGTGEWLLQQPAWNNWCNSCSQDPKDNGLLWLSGKSGSGKSMLSISVYQRLHRLLQPQSPSKDPLVIHARFPGGVGNLEASNPSALCGKLLHRLLTYHLNSERKLEVDVADRLRSLQTEHPFIELDDGKLKFMHSSVRDYCLQSSETLSRHVLGTRALVSITSFESHSKLAEQCFLCLLDAGYGSEDKIGGLLHRNIKSTTGGSALQVLNTQWTVQPPSKGVSFEYAQTNWAFHLTAVDDPEYGLLELAQLFLHVSNFAYWAEYTLLESRNDYNHIRRTNLQLKEWYRALPTPKRNQISVDDYLIYPYTTLSETYKRRQGQDKLLQWLALLQNIRFQRDIGQTLKASPLLAQAVEGLENDLGSEAPLTLRVRSDNATVLLELEAPDKAYSELRALAEIQERLLGEDEPTLFRTLNSRGSAELQLVRFNQNAKTQETACVGFRRLFGAQDPRYLGSRILYALALVQLNQLDTALEILTAVFDYRRKQYGDKDLFTSMAQFPMGDIQRIQGKREQSLKNLKEALNLRLLAVPYDSIWALDIRISLLVAYRDFGMLSEARKAHQHEAVNQLLQEEHVAWYRPQDLWVKFGGPPSDTSLMKAPIAK